MIYYQLKLLTVCLAFVTGVWLNYLQAQPCTDPGHTPETAIQVCGVGTLFQDIVPFCGGDPLPGPCGPQGASDYNPTWFKFKCFKTGTLEFEINPYETLDDYDWQLFDVTGRTPQSVYTIAALSIAGNWSAVSGITGMKFSNGQVFICSPKPPVLPIPKQPRFSKSITIISGRSYLLMISHYTDSPNGFSLKFGGTAIITDPATPGVQKVSAACDGNRLRIKLSKKMRCSTIAADGSDFRLTSGGITIPAAAAFAASCGNSFETDSLVLLLPAPLLPGNYVLRVKTGSDGNSILDFCDKQIDPADSTVVLFAPNDYAHLTGFWPPECAPQEIWVELSQPIKCSSIAPNGSDFTISGPYAAAITGATGMCDGAGMSDRVVITLDKPLYNAGLFTLTLQNGADGNTLITECNQFTPPGVRISFSVDDTVNAAFTYTVRYGCSQDTILLSHPGGNNVNMWLWLSDGEIRSYNQHAQLTYDVFGEKKISLIVSNGTCPAMRELVVNLDNEMAAGFEMPEKNCPDKPVVFRNTSTGKGLKYNWSFGDGTTSTLSGPPPHMYPQQLDETRYTISLKITDTIGCTQQQSKEITMLKTCAVFIPTAFSPNGDGLNDRLFPNYTINIKDFEFLVFDRWGKKVFASTNWQQQWDGHIKGLPAQAGAYVWIFRYTHTETGSRITQKGTVMLLR